MKLSNIISVIEEFAPLSLQETYDNAGLIIGNKEIDINEAIVCIDITEDIIDEAIYNNCNLIISHHPIIFKGLKKINGKNYVERCIIKAIKNNIAIYSAHTNLDNVYNGVSQKICEKLKLTNKRILSPNNNTLKKIVCFCPKEYSKNVKEAMFKGGAGSLGNYDNCCYITEGIGSFKPNKGSNPFIGKENKTEYTKEDKIETIVPSHAVNNVINNMLEAHPYEEVAYDIVPLENINKSEGFGMIGELETAKDSKEFLLSLKKIFKSKGVRHSNIHTDKIKTVAVCGGSGSFLINDAIRNKADIFITGDIKYHDFFNADNKIILTDIGHYESEQYTKEIFYELVTKKLSNFAVRFSEINTNPINYI